MDILEAKVIVQKVLEGNATHGEIAGLRAFIEGQPDKDALVATLFPAGEFWDQEEKALPGGVEQRVLKAILHPQAPVVPLRRRWFSGRRLAAAGAAAALVAACFFLYKANTGGHPTAMLYDSVAVGEGHFENIVLGDGTHLTLNGGSILRWLKTNNREVYLDGEAFFDVARDSLRPFVIHSPSFTTTVLGTSFDIRSRSREAISRVAVATGKIRIDAGGQRSFATPGQQVSLIRDSLRKSTVDIASIGSWKEHRFYYDRASLKDILGDLETVYGLHFNIIDPDVLSCTYSTTFKNVSPDDILETLTLMGRVHFTKKDDRIEVTGKACR
ncbi:FecR family protein [Dinghuibacter silviterrae]|uniref:FecR family protein n=1 Tax=Dinghuibacter silviterrae TaxID=1539049 RepID=A0A4R8DGN6_9BACT|nr:FecR domain-containing protein [Dinghuibacter silviterrae]TDW96823.1 FecR family protein [Dinghuibacter silviterrae]